MLTPFVDGDHQCSNDLTCEFNINSSEVEYALKSADVKRIDKSG